MRIKRLLLAFCILSAGIFVYADTLKEALYYEKLENKVVQCRLCPRKCIIEDARRGFCGVRENRTGTLYSLVYSQAAAVHNDPIEKKPFFHFLPGTTSFSIATAGCNLRCKFCQNWEISQSRPEDIRPQVLTPEEIVKMAKDAGAESIAYTYTEPTIFYEYMLDTAKLAQKEGLKNVMHSAGFINEEPLRNLCKYLDAANIDLKGFTRDYYREMCLGELDDVLRTLKILKEEGVHLEITNLMLPHYNDAPEQVEKMCLWIKENLGTDVPLHFSRFWPMYKLVNLSPTPVETLERARAIALKTGLKYVYIGNIPGHSGETTYCPKCARVLIARVGYEIKENNLADGRCKFCGEKIEGIWRASEEDVLLPGVSGQFYPEDKTLLAQQIDSFLQKANPDEFSGDIFGLISPHAGYEFSGQTAAFGYKLIRNRPYKTVVVIGTGHRYSFKGVSVYLSGSFRTPLGDLEVDSDFTTFLIAPQANINFIPQAFKGEHSVEVQLPFLQKVLKGFKIVPVVVGDADFKTLTEFAAKLSQAIGKRKDVLVVVSTDLSHTYDYEETENIDKLALFTLQNDLGEGIYNKLRGGTIQMCGGLGVAAAILAAKNLGHDKVKILNYTNSAEVTGKKTKGLWTVGYLSAIIDRQERGEFNLNKNQKKRLLQIARETIREYLASGKKPEFSETDPDLTQVNGAFVTLHEKGELRGCIGNIVGKQPLYLTIRDMAIESATGDPRFPAVTKNELKDIEIEISVLSPLKRIKNIDEFILGEHGVLVKSGWNSGVFLPQVATETGWTKEEFLSHLCASKAGLSASAWKNPQTEIYIFSALVFSEKELP